MGNLGVTTVRAHLSADAEKLRAAMVDSSALARMAKVWELTATPKGLRGKRGPLLVGVVR